MASRLLRTSDIAKTLGVHVNTVRNYERWGYLPEIPRGENGYRAFTAVHLEQARLACLVLQWPYLGERTPLVQLVQSAARHDFGTALEMAYDYLIKIRAAYAEAETAVQFLDHWVSGRLLDISSQKMAISQAAEYLDLTVDMLRNWERNGLIEIPRQPSNHYRLYGAEEFARLRVIRRLVQSGFSLMAISRMLQQVDVGNTSSLRDALELPQTESANEAIDIMGDHWLSSLQEVERRAQAIIEHIAHLIELVHSS
jgi:DNA-binding transcriptional MerR regulator